MEHNTRTNMKRMASKFLKILFILQVVYITRSVLENRLYMLVEEILDFVMRVDENR